MNRSRQAHRSTDPLTDTRLQVNITDLVAEYELTHTFRNAGADAIEAVFSFPVPLDDAFLGMQATLAGTTLCAEVLPARSAARNYDDAITDGDSAVLLQSPEPGVLCVSLGNLKPGEQGEVVLRFAVALGVADRSARFSLPLVHRPRYGRWDLEELETPQHDFAAEHPFAARIRVSGLLASAPVHCAAHTARFQRDGDAMVLTLDDGMLDRDLVLVFGLDQPLAPVGRQIDDGDGVIATATFVVPPSNEASRPLDLCLVLDGSGSMCGDAIEQSRDALRAVIASLDESDRIQVLRFGSRTVPMLRRPLKASARVREAVAELAGTVEADLGGTDIGEALEEALKQLDAIRSAERDAAIVLVTDGAVQARALEQAQARAVDAGVRIFVVAVGSSAGAEVLAPLATVTHAVLERAVPAEPIDDCVMRQLRRARAGKPPAITVDWPDPEAEALPVGVVYPGDAATVWARLPGGNERTAVVRIGSSAVPLRVALGAVESAPAIRALFGAGCLHSASPDEQEAIALRYGLLTADTSAVLVKVRAEDDQAHGLPIIRQVAQMVPEGMVAPSAFSLSRRSVAGMSRGRSGPGLVACAMPMVFDDHGDSYADIPAFLRTTRDRAGAPPSSLPESLSGSHIRTLTNALLDALRDGLLGGSDQAVSVDGLIDCLPAEYRSDARLVLAFCGIDDTAPERLVVLLNSLETCLPVDLLPTLDDDRLAALAVRMAAFDADECEAMEQAVRRLVERQQQDQAAGVADGGCAPGASHHRNG